MRQRLNIALCYAPNLIYTVAPNTVPPGGALDGALYKPVVKPEPRALQGSLCLEQWYVVVVTKQFNAHGPTIISLNKHSLTQCDEQELKSTKNKLQKLKVVIFALFQ